MKSLHPMLKLDKLDLDTTVYKLWDFHDRWDSPANFPLGGQSLLWQAQEGHLRALFFIWEKWMKTVSRDTQQSWHEHQSKNPYSSLNIPPFHPKAQPQHNQHSHLLDLFDLDCIYHKSDGHENAHEVCRKGRGMMDEHPSTDHKDMERDKEYKIPGFNNDNDKIASSITQTKPTSDRVHRPLTQPSPSPPSITVPHHHSPQPPAPIPSMSC